MPRYTSYPTAPQFAPKARAARDRTLHRNFQGYTTDPAPVRLGFGPSAIGSPPQGLVQNQVSMHAYRDALRAGGMAADGVVALDGARVRMTTRGRPFVRTLCAAFDRYFEPGETRHAQAV